jgi:undecaprenyl-phosphate galactose phosphotransferase
MTRLESLADILPFTPDHLINAYLENARGLGADAAATREMEKRLFDVLVSAALIVVLLPVMAVLGVLVRLDGGPALFRHQRMGRGGRPFGCLKFRTMVPDSEAMLARVLAQDAEMRLEWEQTRKLRRDPRVTPVGRFLRKTSLDELPQLFNVLRGDMGLVGPRPVVASELDRYGRSARRYTAVRPGITGLWQVSGRSDTDYGRRVALDAYYVREQSLQLDFLILLRTVRVVLRGSGAY